MDTQVIFSPRETNDLLLLINSSDKNATDNGKMQGKFKKQQRL